MYREITTVNTPTYEITIPIELRGKNIEILAFEVEKTKSVINSSKKTSFADKIKGFTLNTGGYKFNRVQANDYP